jgi:predicted RNase H-like nuclease
MTPPRTPLSKGVQMPYSVLAGVVPARGGWLVASAKIQGVTLAPETPVLKKSLQDVLDTKPSFQTIALAAPIGLLDDPSQGSRRCDVEARRILGWPRGAAVLEPPYRKTLAAKDYDEARAVNGGQLSGPQWRRLPRVVEVDEEMAPYWQRTVYEVDPELSFYQLNGERPLKYSKHSSRGREERIELLGAKFAWLDRILGRGEGQRPASSQASLLDAAICLWASRRITSRGIMRIPERPVWDSSGLRMEIVY